MIVCVRMKMCVDVTECMNVWLSPICLSSVNTSECVCVHVGWLCQASGFGGTAGWRAVPLTRMDGWMWTSLSRSFHSDWADSSVWDAVVISLVWCALQPFPLMDHSESPPPPPSPRFLENAQKGLTRGCRGTQMCICQREWTSGFICNCILHWDKWCFSKTSAEKQVQKCGLTLLVAHYKWFLSAGGVPSSPCHLLFSPTNCLFCCFYLSPSFKRALTAPFTLCFTLF